MFVIFYKSPSWCIANQSGSAKKTVSQKIGENIATLVWFICMGAHDRTLIDINHHYQIMMNEYKNCT